MFTVEQSAKVKQLVIKQYKQFVTNDQLTAMYALDFKQYEEIRVEANLTSYSAYFEELDDEFAQIQFLDMVVEPVLLAA
jgi:hypothetical protein|tara:strand:- start:119 stop:355 length:237 start_codon:yes stop_codon:yes gene_type:complete